MRITEAGRQALEEDKAVALETRNPWHLPIAFTVSYRGAAAMIPDDVRAQIADEIYKIANR